MSDDKVAMRQYMKKKSSNIEYWILFFLSGGIAFKCERAYETTGLMKYTYLAAFLFVLCLFSCAKIGIFNIFLIIRKFPKSIKNAIQYLINDYKEWKINKRRQKYEYT